MPRCASSLVVAAYAKVRLTPRVSCALPAAFFTKPSPVQGFFMTFYESVMNASHDRLEDVLRRNDLAIVAVDPPDLRPGPENPPDLPRHLAAVIHLRDDAPFHCCRQG